MFKPQSELDTNLNPDTKIWRYMNLKKFRDMVETSSLYFASPDQFADKKELFLAEKNYENFTLNNDKSRIGGEQGLDTVMRNLIKINCWNISDSENPELWAKFVNHSGFAIQSTFKKLTENFSKTYEIISGTYVRYTHRIKEGAPGTKGYHRIFWKDTKYSYENELRFITGHDFSQTKPHFVKFASQPIGVKIPFNIKQGLEKIIIGPKNSEEDFSEVRELLLKHGLDVPFEKSYIKN